MGHTHPAQDPELPGSKEEEGVIFGALESETDLKSTPPSACLMCIYGSQGPDNQEGSDRACGKKNAQTQGHMERGITASASIYTVSSWRLMNTIASLRLSTAGQEQEDQGVYSCVLSESSSWRAERA